MIKANIPTDNVVEAASRAMGNMTALAHLCGVSRQRVRQWVDQGRIPQCHWKTVHDATGISTKALRGK